MLVVNHIAADEWSARPLAADLRAAYAGRTAAPLPVQYADFAVWHRALLDGVGGVGDAQLDFWRATLAGLPDELTLPADRPRPAESDHRGAVVEFRVDPAVEAGLRALAAAGDASMFMVVQAAVAALLTRLGAGTDIPLGSPIAGRSEAELDDLVGFFLNTLVLRTDTSGDPTFRDLLARVRAADLAAFSHQDVPFERVVEALNPPRSLARHPLFQAMVVYIPAEAAGSGLDLPGLIDRPEPIETRTAKFDWSFDLVEHADGLHGAVEYRTDMIDAATAETVTDALQRVLAAVVADPGRPIGAIDVVGEALRHRISAWGSGPAPEEAPSLLDALAAADPAAPALVTDARTWTFGELDAFTAASRRAACVPAAPAPEQVVALALPRAWMVPGLDRRAAVGRRVPAARSRRPGRAHPRRARRRRAAARAHHQRRHRAGRRRAPRHRLLRRRSPPVRCRPCTPTRPPT